MGVSRQALLGAVARIERGSVDAYLGSGLIKQRVQTNGKGKSGGARTLLFHKHGQHIVFIHIFTKSRQSNLTDSELDALRDVAKSLASIGAEEQRTLLETRQWSRIE
jgi:hypothetical protein